MFLVHFGDEGAVEELSLRDGPREKGQDVSADGIGGEGKEYGLNVFVCWPGRWWEERLWFSLFSGPQIRYPGGSRRLIPAGILDIGGLHGEAVEKRLGEHRLNLFELFGGEFFAPILFFTGDHSLVFVLAPVEVAMGMVGDEEVDEFTFVVVWGVFAGDTP